MTLKSLILLGISAAILISCGSDRLDVDVSDVEVDIRYINLDSIFVHSDSLDFISAHEILKKDVKEIYDYELGYCLKFANVSAEETYSIVQIFKEDKYIKRLENQIGSTFPSNKLSGYNNSIDDGFRHLKYHLPKQKLPVSIVYMNSFFTSNIFSTETDIGVGLERYLGPDVDVIKELPENQIYGWIKDAMDVKFLERDVLAGWVSTNIVEDSEGNLADQLIRWGKVLYLVEAAFPDFDKEIIMRYTKENYDWANENEPSFWKYLVDENLLFKTEELVIQNMIKEGPFTPGLPEKGPDRLGQFLGWKMVRQYMTDNDEVSFEQLLTTPYNNILQNYETE
jgi:hypothetical protein